LIYTATVDTVLLGVEKIHELFSASPSGRQLAEYYADTIITFQGMRTNWVRTIFEVLAELGYLITLVSSKLDSKRNILGLFIVPDHFKDTLLDNSTIEQGITKIRIQIVAYQEELSGCEDYISYNKQNVKNYERLLAEVEENINSTSKKVNVKDNGKANLSSFFFLHR